VAVKKKSKKKYSCSHCEQEFSSPHQKKYCSTDCRKKAAAQKPVNLNQFIINKFLKQPKTIWNNKGAAIREMGLAKKMIEIYSLEIFWRALPPAFLTETLAWYLSPAGKEYLKVEFAKFSLDLRPPPTHNIAAVKFGEDKIFRAKPKTLRDFLNNGSKEKKH
tara:strand:+ start:1191 stop:1676 length:486 start_codon:yes stop_codon:yes gene_type:complete